MALRGGLGHQGAGASGAGEGDMRDARMGAQRRARFMTVATDHVDRALRKTHLGRQFRQAQQRQAGVLGGLDHTGVARRQGGTDAAAEDLHRVVPGNDVPGDAMGLAHREHGIAGLIGQGLAMQLVGGPGVVLEIARQGRGIGAGHLQRLAGVPGLDLRQLFVVLQHRLAQARQQAPALQGRQAAPGPVEVVAQRPLRGLYRQVDVLGGAAGDPRVGDAGAGVEYRNVLGPGRGLPLVVDVVFEAHFHQLLLPARHSAIARPTSTVLAVPPISRVRGPSASTVSMLSTIAAAARW